MSHSPEQLPSDSNSYEYDVFISYSTQDQWVRRELLRRLEDAGLKCCIDYRDFRIGAPAISELKRAATTSRKTLMVLTPNYLKSKWTEFERYLLWTPDPLNKELRLIPLLKEPCELPPDIGYLTYLNFVDPDDPIFAWTQLLTALGKPPVTTPLQIHILPEKQVSEEAKEPTKVFISYSWDSEEHKNNVLAVANTLRKPWGIETDIDQYVRAKPPYTPRDGWDLWMEKRIEWADFVLIVCTETYRRRFRGDEESGQGRGATWEGTIIRQSLYNNLSRDTKFIPVVFSQQDVAHIPLILNSHDRYILDNEESLKTLVYRLRGKAIVAVPEVAPGDLPPPSKSVFWDTQKPSIEPPPVSLDLTQIETSGIAQTEAGEILEIDPSPILPKELRECHPAKLRFIKNIKDPNLMQWAYSLDRMERPESRAFELMWRATSHGVDLPKTGDLMILHQRAKVTHVVEFLDDQVRKTDSGFFRWVRAVWLAEQDWNQLPHQKDILGFSPNYADGNTHSFNSPNFSTFRKAWGSLEEFQKHIFKLLA
ncbi:MAG: toll/interleukin-1 receptor domain-containing protein [Oscillatoriophycideae cyanobacterium NC_groundwater_1537_Pr4_S-0.65um_50_18]|nr:toll/interleukin-1 receptor domain-containing protein [Oscillatoriophycideae cyanobacterium NC_groundwater_1537_Pr4_S-0.65um_50_18]